MTKERLEVLNRHLRICSAIRAGESAKDIASREGYTVGNIRRIAKRNGLSFKARYSV